MRANLVLKFLKISSGKLTMHNYSGKAGRIRTLAAFMDSNSRQAFSPEKFSFKGKQFFSLTQGLRFRSTKTKTLR